MVHVRILVLKYLAFLIGLPACMIFVSHFVPSRAFGHCAKISVPYSRQMFVPLRNGVDATPLETGGQRRSSFFYTCINPRQRLT